MATYRVIVLFDAPGSKEAKTKAQAAAHGAGGKVDRLTVQRTTWGPIDEENASESK